MSFPTICGTSLPIVTLQAALLLQVDQVKHASAFTSTASLSGARVVAHFESRLA
jgi:hypothetical protein